MQGWLGSQPVKGVWEILSNCANMAKLSSPSEQRMETVEVWVGMLLYFLIESRVWTGFYTYIRLCFPVLPNLYLFFVFLFFHLEVVWYNC